MFTITHKEVKVSELDLSGLSFVVMPDGKGGFDLGDYCEFAGLYHKDADHNSVATTQDRASSLWGSDIAMVIDHTED